MSYRIEGTASEIDEVLNMAYELLNKLTYVVDKNNMDDVYAVYELEDGTRRVEKLFSNDFQSVIRNYLREEKEIVKVPSLKPLLNAIADKRLEYEAVELHTRFAGDDDMYEYFFADENKKCIQIRANKVKFTKTPKYYFLQKRNTLPQTIPKKTDVGLYDLLRKYINLNDDDYKLFLTYLCQLFMYNTAHMICIISSEHGSGKSTFTRIIRRLVDPTRAENALVPKSIDDLLNHCANNNVVCFDNTKCLSNDESDVLCAAVTGATLPKRTLYTTSEETLLFLKNIVIINGINIIPKKSDFIERSLLFELQKMTTDKRKSENEFFSEFEKDKPFIMYRIFKTVSEAMKVKETLKLDKSHRMYDAFFDMCAIAVALGFDLEEYQEIFFENNKKLELAYAENNSFVNAIVDYMQFVMNDRVFSATMTQAYRIIGKYYDGSDFPKSASAFSRKLHEEESAIREMGYHCVTKLRKDATHLTISKAVRTVSKK